MKSFTIILLLSILAVFELAAQTGFSSATRLNPVSIAYSTKNDPQAKVWTYAGKWWSVLATSTGTKIFRLDGVSWTPVLTLNATDRARADCRVVGDLVHVLLYRGASSNSYVYSVQYNAATNTYQLWSQRPEGSALSFPSGSQTATLAVDGTGRMWVASDAGTAIQVWWSDAPYTTWSAPITLATGMRDDDICAVTVLPGKIGVFWSNQVTKRYGFRTHTDGSDPNTWLADEVPASQSAVDNVGLGMADDHMNLKVASDGTLYVAITTTYRSSSLPRVALLVRRPNGTWDDLHPGTMDPEGEIPIVILNEAKGKVRLVYTSVDDGGDILYRESSTSNISFGPAQVLMSGGGQLYDYTASTHQNFSSEIVLLATNLSTSPIQAEGVLVTDDGVDNTAPSVMSINRQSPTTATTNATSVTFRVTFSEAVTGVGTGDFTLTKTNTANGTIASVSGGGATYDVTVNNITGSGTLRLDLNGSGTGIADAAGNAIAGGFTAGQSYTIAQNIPGLTFVGIASNNTNTSLAKVGDIITLSFTASEPINAPTVTIATHNVTASAGSSNSFTAAYTMTASDASGVVPFTINFSSTSGTAGTQVTTTTNGSSVSFDKTAPSVVSINRLSPATEITSATSVIYRVTFSEAVTGVGTGDFSLTKASTVNGTIASLSGSGTTYDVTVNAISGSGSIRLDLNSSGTGILDAAGNAISSGFTTGQSYTISNSPPPASYGFASVTALSSFSIGDDTQHKPQGKVWTYAGKWWCAASASGMKIFRLDGTTWTPVMNVSNRGGRADCWVVGDLVHILSHRPSSESYLATAQFDPATGAYKPWSQRPTNTIIKFPSGSKTATLTVDGTGRMWVASDVTFDIRVWYSDAPYTTWSAPINLVNGISSDDICAITKLPGKIGVFWSNQSTGLFGFKTHTDGAAPNAWSEDEKPASQSAIPGVPRMADDHMSLVPASDGTLYVAIKTGYNDEGRTQLGLMVRRPAGSWDPLYPVIINDGSNEGTQPIVIVNESLGKVKVVYTTITNGGVIAYRESSTSNISFGAQKTLITAGGNRYNFASSTHQTYNPEVVIIATDIFSRKLHSVLASDVSSSATGIASSGMADVSIAPDELTGQNLKTGSLQLYPNPFSGNATLSFTLAEEGKYTISLYDSNGSKVLVLKEGWAEAGVFNTVSVDGAALSAGLYFVSLQTDKGIQTIKMLVRK